MGYKSNQIKNDKIPLVQSHKLLTISIEFTSDIKNYY